MEKLTRMSAEILKVASLEQLREALARGVFNARWRTALEAEIDSRLGVKPGEAWPLSDGPVPPKQYGPSPWRTRPGTPERFEEEDEAIHGVN